MKTLKTPIELDIKLISDMEFDGIDNRDYPDFSDMFCSSALYNGKEMTDEQLDYLNSELYDYVYEKFFNSLH